MTSTQNISEELTKNKSYKGSTLDRANVLAALKITTAHEWGNMDEEERQEQVRYIVESFYKPPNAATAYPMMREAREISDEFE